MNRRSVLAALGGTALWPLAAQAQQPSIPAIGFLSTGSSRSFENFVSAFRAGLEERGYVVGRDVWIDFRWAEGHYGELPAMAADLVRRQVSLIAATGGVVSAEAAIKATSTIPIVFVVGFDPVQLKLVASVNRPGGNATGVSIFTTELAAKRLELLNDLLPSAKTIGILVNPGSATTDIEINDMLVAAQEKSLKLVAFQASTEEDFVPAYEAAVSQKVGAILVSADPFFTIRRQQLVALSARYMLPAIYPLSAYVEAGGFVSYGTELPWAYRQAGRYAGRILQGAKPSELPVMQPTNFDLVINLNTASALGMTVPPLVLARATKVVERDPIVTKP